MNSKSLKRLAADHGALHNLGLPPNYIFPPASSSLSSCCDDLTSLDVLLAGPEGTAYSTGIFHLHLTIPKEYPNLPPKASFRTKIWHPNVDEQGSVCVDTLKSGWEKGLSLRDVLVTISCLLIQPNPASALNAEAGRLIQDGDWAAFEKRARVMCGIHARIPEDLRGAVEEARRRGEDIEEKGEVKKIKGKGKAKAIVKIQEVDINDEENATAERTQPALDADSDPETDWIPRPAHRPLDLGTDNIPNLKPTTTSKDTQSEDAMDLDSSLSTVVHHDISAHTFPPPCTPTKPKSTTSSRSTSSSSINPSSLTPVPVYQHSPQDANKESQLPAFDFEWMKGKSPKGKGKRSPETLRRRRSERRKMRAAGFEVERWNRGVFGPRRGLLRL